jgi:hypothetical protein
MARLIAGGKWQESCQLPYSDALLLDELTPSFSTWDDDEWEWLRESADDVAGQTRRKS